MNEYIWMRGPYDFFESVHSSVRLIEKTSVSLSDTALISTHIISRWFVIWSIFELDINDISLTAEVE